MSTDTPPAFLAQERGVQGHQRGADGRVALQRVQRAGSVFTVGYGNGKRVGEGIRTWFGTKRSQVQILSPRFDKSPADPESSGTCPTRAGPNAAERSRRVESLRRVTAVLIARSPSRMQAAL